MNKKELASEIAMYYDEDSFFEDFNREDFKKHILEVLKEKEMTEIGSLIDYFEKQSTNNSDMVAKVILTDLRQFIGR